MYPTIHEALRCGGSNLAVDAVLVIGEHGDYPRNDKGQVLYPRYDFVKQCVDVFEKDGRAVPLYNDKHLSFSFEKARWMVDASKRLKFPMLAGSSLPVTWRLPDIELALNAEIESAVMVGYGGPDVMDFHGLEALQIMPGSVWAEHEKRVIESVTLRAGLRENRNTQHSLHGTPRAWIHDVRVADATDFKGLLGAACHGQCAIGQLDATRDPPAVDGIL